MIRLFIALWLAALPGLFDPGTGGVFAQTTIPFSSGPATAGGGGGGGSIPTITAGTAQPGSQAYVPASTQGFWVNWAPIPASSTDTQQGSAGVGFADNAIAEWDAVQYSWQSGTFNVCVVGYHASGSVSVPLASVTFYLDNGAGVAVNAPNLTRTLANSMGTVPEYCVQATDTALNDGQHEFRAVACPVRGYCRVLQSVVPVAATSGNPVLARRAHGQQGGTNIGKVGFVTGATGSDFTNSTAGSLTLYCVSSTGIDPNHFELALYTGGSGGTGGTCGTPITPTASYSFNFYYLNAGLNEPYSTTMQGESLFVTTNGHGNIRVANMYVDSLHSAYTSGATGCGTTAITACPDTTTAFANNEFFGTGDNQTFAWNSGSPTLTLSGQPWANGQAIVFPSTFDSSLPTPLLKDRPYWVVGAVANTSIQIALTPGGSPISITQSGSGTVQPWADFSGYTMYLECSTSASVPSGCPSPPATYAIGKTTGIPNAYQRPTTYSYFTIAPYPGTPHTSVVANNGNDGNLGGNGDGLVLDKLHMAVDINENDVENGSTHWASASWAIWFDTLNYQGIHKYNQDSGLSGMANSHVYEAVTSTTQTGMYSGPIYNHYQRDNVIHDVGGACGMGQLTIGYHCYNVADQSSFLVAMTSAPSLNTPTSGSTTFHFGAGNIPSQATIAGGGDPAWIVASANGSPPSGCMGSQLTITSINNGTGDVVTTGAPTGTCGATEKVAIETVSHSDAYFIANAEANLIMWGFDGSNAFGSAMLFNQNGTIFDWAFVNGNLTAGTSGPTGPWGRSTQALRLKAAIETNLIFSSMAWTNDGMIPDGGTTNVLTDLFVQNSTCSGMLATELMSHNFVAGSTYVGPPINYIGSPTC